MRTSRKTEPNAKTLNEKLWRNFQEVKDTEKEPKSCLLVRKAPQTH